MVSSKESAQAGEQRAGELGTSVRHYLCRHAKMADPHLQELCCHGLGVDVWKGNDFQPPGAAVDDGEQVLHLILDLNRADKVNIYH